LEIKDGWWGGYVLYSACLQTNPPQRPVFFLQTRNELRAGLDMFGVVLCIIGTGTLQTTSKCCYRNVEGFFGGVNIHDKNWLGDGCFLCILRSPPSGCRRCGPLAFTAQCEGPLANYCLMGFAITRVQCKGHPQRQPLGMLDVWGIWGIWEFLEVREIELEVVNIAA
jgi:hypothetical protein